MSASMKLKALDEGSDLRRIYVWVDGEERDVTAQILAVVELAEAARPHDPRIASLDEALEAKAYGL